jgi:hypothetical protein
MAIALMLTLTGYVNAAGNSFPSGTKGWIYYIGIDAIGYAASPEEACKLTAKNHMGTALVDMRRYHGSELLIECKYPHFLAIGGVQWYGATFLECESGYRPTPEGICAKMTEPAPLLHCKPGEAGYEVGNPVVVASGAKVQGEMDLVGAASNLPKVERTYRVFRSFLKSTSGGQSWSFWFDRAFVVTQRNNDGRPTLIEAADGTGAYLKFVWNPSTRKYESTYDKSATLEVLDASYDDWLLTHRGQAERFRTRTILAYAGIAKAGSVLAASGAEASAFRQGLKGLFRFGAAKNWRPPDLSKYPTDDALRAAAGRTNPGMNAYGAGVAAAGATGATCGCPN